jgi:hypothetical protein
MADAGKRARDDTPLGDWDTGAVLSWLRSCDAVPVDLLEALTARVEEQEVDGEVLASLSEAELGAACVWRSVTRACGAAARESGAIR